MTEKPIEYFGTDLEEHGHYRWVISDPDSRLIKSWLKFDDLPFHPEYLTNNLKNGDIAFYQTDFYTVIAICGSPKDERPGSKSVFWVNEKLTREDFLKRIKASELAMTLINAMPFKVKFDNYT